MKFINDFHRESTLRKLKQIEEWRKHPAPLAEVLARQRKREQQAIEMDKQKLLENIKKNNVENE